MAVVLLIIVILVLIGIGVLAGQQLARVAVWEPALAEHGGLWFPTAKRGAEDRVPRHAARWRTVQG